MDLANPSDNYHSYLRLALPLMSKYHIPVIPQNYTVWYAYVSGANEPLRQTINGMIQKGHRFDNETNTWLYRQFGLGIDDHELRKVRDDLKQLLIAILDQVMTFCDQTDTLESILNISVDKLSGEVSISELKTIVDQIINDTRAVGGLGKILHRHLEQKAKELDELKREFDNARKESMTDFLTGLDNRKSFDRTLVEATHEAVKNDKPLCMLLVDIDHFKTFNDQYGHLIGDEVIKFVAQKMKELVRGKDIVARFGGEEFSLLLSQTSLNGATAVAENLRSYFSEAKLRTSQGKILGNITVSVGAACYRYGEPLEDFINRADSALYKAKKLGRNRIALETELS